MPRYIDADALIERLGINQDCTECSYCTRKYFCSWNPDPGEICIAISEQPVVTINDHPEEIKVTNCNYNQFAEVSKKGDLINREDALNCFHDWIDAHGDVHTADEMPEYQRIEQLPSTQPEIIRCKDCKHFIRDIPCVEGHYDGCDEWTDNGNEIMVAEDDFCSYAKRRTDE